MCPFLCAPIADAIFCRFSPSALRTQHNKHLILKNWIWTADYFFMIIYWLKQTFYHCRDQLAQTLTLSCQVRCLIWPWRRTVPTADTGCQNNHVWANARSLIMQTGIIKVQPVSESLSTSCPDSMEFLGKIGIHLRWGSNITILFC